MFQEFTGMRNGTTRVVDTHIFPNNNGRIDLIMVPVGSLSEEGGKYVFRNGQKGKA